MTDAELRDQVNRALRHFMQRQPHADQVASIAEQIRHGCASTGRRPTGSPAPDAQHRRRG